VTLLEVRWPDGGLQYLENVAADQHLTIQQDAASYATQLALSRMDAKAWVRTNTEPQRLVPTLDASALDRMLAEMESHLGESLEGFKLASDYRGRCVDYGQHDRSIAFFEKLVAARPESARARIELACAYVDKIPTCGGMAAIVSKGTLARRSLDQLDAVLAKEQDLWIANYTRGINHLNWPRALRHSEAAAADLSRCVKLQEKDHQPKSYYVRTYVALGDAQTKAKNHAKARRAWREGLKLFPQSGELTARLEISDDKELLRYVESQRSLQNSIDTDLSFLDRP
jgi:tetratricopeptide (TPR) repeat protein